MVNQPLANHAKCECRCPVKSICCWTIKDCIHKKFQNIWWPYSHKTLKKIINHISKYQSLSGIYLWVPFEFKLKMYITCLYWYNFVIVCITVMYWSTITVSIKKPACYAESWFQVLLMQFEFRVSNNIGKIHNGIKRVLHIMKKIDQQFIFYRACH